MKAFFDEHYKGNLTWLAERTIILMKHGSHAYGTATPTSDVDVKGVVVPPKEVLLGFIEKFEQADKGWEGVDCTIYSLQKAMGLAADNNPNMIELPFVDPSDWLHAKVIPYNIRRPSYWKPWETVVENRDLFLSQNCKYRFSGYAVAQLKRIRAHRGWLFNPPKGPEDDNWKKFLDWQQNRNEKRSELEAKFGYDTKHGMHLVRLMRMAVEILEGKGVIVKRPDAEELLAIRNGAWSFDKIEDWADLMEKRIEELMATTKLPENPNRKKLDDICVEIVECMLK